MRCQFKSFYFIIFSFAFLALASCNSTRKVQKRGGYLLTKNVIRIDNSYIPSDETEGFVQQKAVKNVLTYFHPGVWVYRHTSQGKQTRFRKYLKQTFGTEPVLYDSNLTLRSAALIKQYTASKGFPSAAVSHEAIYKGSHAEVIYRITTGTPYLISSFNTNIPDSAIENIYFKTSNESLIKTGVIFDTYVLDDERDRFATVLKNRGYYSFSKTDITYTADTTLGEHRVEVVLDIADASGSSTKGGDSLSPVSHPKFYFRNIYVNTDIDALVTSGAKPDTIPYYYPKRGSDTISPKLYFIQTGPAKLRFTTIADAVVLSEGQPFSLDAGNLTYKRLVNLSAIRSVTVSYTPVASDSNSMHNRELLDCNIRLSRNQAFILNVGTEGTNSGGTLGMGVNTLMMNRNIFRGSETFRIKFTGAAEVQGNLPEGDKVNKFLFFNTFQAGIETGLDIPRLLIPFHLFDNSAYSLARTSISAGYNFENRPDYTRKISTLLLSYQWSKSEKTRYIFTPLELNFVGISTDSTFQAYLNSLSDPYFVSQYSDHLLGMIRFSITHSNQMLQKQKRLYFIRFTAETAGNVLHTFDNISGSLKTENSYYEHFGVRYAQYFRLDIDMRHFWEVADKSTFAVRLAAGTGIPYGNSDALPFEKGFWLGGANDMRGWKFRSLGPGTYSSQTIRYDRTGDIMIQGSAEYRFPIYSFIHGSLFADAGNIWLRKENPDFSGGEFRLKSFVDQLALDTGFGLRFDFSFFIFRLDWGLRTKNPALENQWFNSDDFRLRKAVWNFGIGYPF
jgi:outer membrane protein assembly factor BamA